MASRIRRFRRLSSVLMAAALGVPAGSMGVAHADSIDDVGRKLSKHQKEIGRIDSAIRPPSSVGSQSSDEAVSRKLINAQVQFGMGNFDDASVLLYDIVEAHPTHRSYDEAIYYLAESLFQKQDDLAARAYFIKLIAERGSASKYFQQGLERLIELSLRLQDDSGIQDWLAALDSLPKAGRRASIPYVRGKYAHFQGDYDTAIKHFSDVPTNSKYSFQAQYFIGAALIAKGNLGAAARTFGAITKRRAKTEDDRRVRELAHMAAGRLHYERDQPSKAIDSYLNVSRKSDLFDDVLYEVAWVYVKNKAFSRALRALELLELTDPNSSRMPEVRILEGNLRIRKAQTQYDKGLGNPAEEYDRALKVFTQTREAFTEPQAALAKLLAEQGDAVQFIQQITGRESKTFEAKGELPEVAAAWLREEPDVQRLVGVETDLGEIERHVAEAEQTIRRLELATSTDARIDIFPELAERRYQILDIREATDKARGKLLAELAKRAKKNLSSDELQSLQGFSAEREGIQNELDALSGKASATERAKTTKGRFTQVDQSASELRVVIGATEAEIVALEQYLKTAENLPKNIEEIKTQLAAEKNKVVAMRKELDNLRDDTKVGRDASGASADAAREKELRAELRKSLNAEAALVAGMTDRMSGGDRNKANKILGHLKTANNVIETSDRVLDKIDAVVDGALAAVRKAVAEERAHLAAYRQEFTTYEAESRELGSEVLANAFGEVSKKFRDVLMRSDVGIVDVSWSHKESNERLRRRLVLDRARERKTLSSDFADVIEELQENREREAQKEKTGGKQ